MVKVINKTTKAVFHLDLMSAAEILKKYHDLEVVEASIEEKQELDKSKDDPAELAILGQKSKSPTAGKAQKAPKE